MDLDTIPPGVFGPSLTGRCKKSSACPSGMHRGDALWSGNPDHAIFTCKPEKEVNSTMNDIKSFAVALFVLIGLPTIASACPDYSAYGAEYSYTGDQLYQPRSFSVIAGGSNNLRNCPVREDGYVTTPPDFTFSLRDMGNYRLEIEVESDCDAILLVNSADGS